MAITLRIELLHMEPLIWRRLIVPAEATLEHLHIAIQGAFSWEDRHLWQFQINEQKYEIPDVEGGEVADGCKNARDFSLGKLVKSGSEFYYTYDFGDNWQHRIIVEKKRKRKNQDYTFIPICVAGERAAPPEDCGGPHEYLDFLHSFLDSNHSHHKNAGIWALGFQPEIFSAAQANSLIAAIYVWLSERQGTYLGNVAPFQIACPDYK